MGYFANYRFAAEKAAEVLKDAGIIEAPVNPALIFEWYSNEISCITYSKFMRTSGSSIGDVISFFNSDMGSCVFEQYMSYPKYREEVLFVGSGAMESANIYMMQDRMKLPGMRWRIVNGRHMLCLKSYYASRNWDQIDKEMATYCGISG